MISEDRLQQICFTWHWNTYREQRGLLWHVDNNSQGGRVGKIKKALGVVSGVSDLHYARKGKIHFFELKTEDEKKSNQSKAQKEWQRKVELEGFDYHLIRTFTEFKQKITSINEI